MTKESQDFELYTGDHKRPEITVKDRNGNKVNLEGASVEWVAVDTAADGLGEVMRKSTDGGGININDAKNGKFIVKIDSTDTDTINQDATLEHEARVTNSSDLNYHVTVGQIDLIESNI